MPPDARPTPQREHRARPAEPVRDGRRDGDRQAARRRGPRAFTSTAIPGTYLRVVAPGAVTAGDAIVVSRRPTHDVTVARMFRALTLEPDLIPSLEAALERDRGITR